ncbi:hypothetical protein, partial [Peribacillus frigoritolerans]|uniref:hypothetical protein n=1 Tax=Peribacillus frigoritolerans TaxID=450367 RepID=UPI001E3732BD
MKLKRVSNKKTIKILNNISFSGVLVIILAIYIGVFGIIDYQNKESSINAKYNYLLSIGNLSLADEYADALIPH